MNDETKVVLDVVAGTGTVAALIGSSPAQGNNNMYLGYNCINKVKD